VCQENGRYDVTEALADVMLIRGIPRLECPPVIQQGTRSVCVLFGTVSKCQAARNYSGRVPIGALLRITPISTLAPGCAFTRMVSGFWFLSKNENGCHPR
jgi:hypothetical protein